MKMKMKIKIKKKSVISFFALLIIYSNTVFANPMFSPEKSASNSNGIRNELVLYPDCITKLIHNLITVQKKINTSLTFYIKEIKNNSLEALFYLLFTSFIYGIIHALGPGHGKALVTSYFLSQKAKIRKGFLAGLLIALVHSFSAVLIIGSIFLFIRTSLLINFENIRHYVSIISFSIIILIGFYMILSAIKETVTGNNPQTEGIKIIEDNRNNNPTRGFTAIVLTAGIIPCPGAAMILLFAINMNIFYAGLFSVICMSCGMAVTISAAGIISILIKKYSLKIPGINNKINFQNITELISGFLIISIGIILLLSVV